MLIFKNSIIYRKRKNLFTPRKALVVMSLYSLFTVNSCLASENSNEAINVHTANTGALAVVLNPEDIHTLVNTDEINSDLDDSTESTSDEPEHNNQKNSESNEKNSNKNSAQSENQKKILPSIPVIMHQDPEETLPQVASQTQHIGTPENPTIDGGLISAPELVGTLSAKATVVSSESESLAVQDFLFKTYFLWEEVKHYDLRSQDLYTGLSYLKRTHEFYTHKIAAKYTQIMTYWTKPLLKKTRHPLHTKKPIVRNHLEKLSVKSDISGDFYGRI
ncbi:MAG: hypothetical protein K2Q33_07560 [Gammaproteobacteria bacterium]|nr:hypothetical protein [Gammaproteobacteria bacterium]